MQGQEKRYLSTLQVDPDVTSAMSKVIAHLESSARHCQSLKNKFLSFSFVWEQDVEESFDLFLKGKYASRGHRLTGPQTVRASAWSSHGRWVQCFLIGQQRMKLTCTWSQTCVAFGAEQMSIRTSGLMVIVKHTQWYYLLMFSKSCPEHLCDACHVLLYTAHIAGNEQALTCGLCLSCLFIDQQVLVQQQQPQFSLAQWVSVIGHLFFQRVVMRSTKTRN